MFIIEGGLGVKSDFYTLKGYKLKEKNKITEAMEDYIEMIYRKTKNNKFVTIKELANFLNVKPSSTSKMANRLKNLEMVEFEKYDKISLTENGKLLGKYLLWRHNLLKKFFKCLNGNKYSLKQVEKIEHFIDNDTLINIERIIKKIS